MIEDPHVAGHDLVVEDGTGRNINAIAVICNDDDRPAQGNAPTEGHIA